VKIMNRVSDQVHLVKRQIRYAAALALAAAAVVSSAAHAWHAAEPAVSLYLPTAHAEHAWPFSPV
jgi:hypothetical protein